MRYFSLYLQDPLIIDGFFKFQDILMLCNEGFCRVYKCICTSSLVCIFKIHSFTERATTTQDEQTYLHCFPGSSSCKYIVVKKIVSVFSIMQLFSKSSFRGVYRLRPKLGGKGKCDNVILRGGVYRPMEHHSAKRRLVFKILFNF